jgi:hypothetical protein
MALRHLNAITPNADSAASAADRFIFKLRGV